MSIEASRSDYFIAGGTLRPGTPSYVKRPADDELLELALAGEYCYALTPRQMGKSSLMIRVAQRLRAQGINTGIIDLTKIGTEVSIEQWYLGLLTQIRRSLRLSVAPEEWWQLHAKLGYPQRFIDFLRDVVLIEIEGRVVIFVDEIDTTLNLGFRDDFFAAIRAMYNDRANDREFERLTFVLLGVASPPELIKDPDRTPFNIGHGITVQEFTRPDAAVLRDGLETACPGQGDAIFDRIYHWTDGHPYLTQKLCLAVAESEEAAWTDERVDGLVERLFLSEEARRETNLQFVQDKILNDPKRGELLAIYRSVLRGKRVRDDGQSPVQNQLKLSGLVKTENGYLRIRNELYRRAFGRAWVRKHTEINWPRVVAGAAVIVAVLAMGLLLYNAWVGIRFNDCAASFYQADNPQERLVHLAKAFRLKPLFGPSDYTYRARDWFYGLSKEQQLALFEIQRVEGRDTVVVIRGLYVTLADVDGTDSTGPLLASMTVALHDLEGIEEADGLAHEIEAWRRGRQAVKEKRWEDARAAFDEAIALNGENPATLYERAKILTEIGEYELALNDLERVMSIAREEPRPTPTPSPTYDSESTVPTTSASAVTGTSTSDAGTAPVPTQIASSTPLGNPVPTELATEFTQEDNPMNTPTPTAAPDLVSIRGEFLTSSDIANAVRTLIYRNPGLVDVLMQDTGAGYPNLRESGLAPTPTVTNTPVTATQGTPESTKGLTPTAATSEVLPAELSGQIIFPQFDASEQTINLYIADVSGTDRQLLLENASQPGIDWSQTRFAYRSWQADNRGLFIRQITPGSQFSLESDTWQVTRAFEADRLALSWDGQSIVYSSSQGGDRQWRLYNVSGEALNRNDQDVLGNTPAWLPDGRIVFSACQNNACGLFLMNPNGSDFRQITSDAGTSPSASPDGTRIAYVSQAKGDFDIYLINADGSGSRQMTRDSANDALPVWSPDGQWIAFVSNRNEQWAIWAVRVQDWQERQLFALDAPPGGCPASAMDYECGGWQGERIVWVTSPSPVPNTAQPTQTAATSIPTNTPSFVLSETPTQRPTITSTPSTPTPTSSPTRTATPTPTPSRTPTPSSSEWTITETLIGPGENGQGCGYGNLQIHVSVVDANNSQIPGVWLYDRYSGQYQMTGNLQSSGLGAGETRFEYGMGGGGGLCIAAEQGGACISDYTRDMPCYDPPPFEDMWAAGYCECCEVGITRERCQELYNAGASCMGSSHYSWRVVFKKRSPQQYIWTGQTTNAMANCGLTRIFGYTLDRNGGLAGDVWVHFWTDGWEGAWARSQWSDFGAATPWEGDDGNWDGTIDTRPREGVWYVCVTPEEQSWTCISNTVVATTASDCQNGSQVVTINFQEN